MIRLNSLLLSMILLSAAPCLAQKASPSEPNLRQSSISAQKTTPPTYENLKGWEHLFKQLVKYGANPEECATVFRDKRMPSFDGLTFAVNPREPHSIYRGINSNSRNNKAMKFYLENASYFELAEQRYGVPQSVILAIIQVETNSGSFIGKSRVIYGLARLAAASDPKNIDRVYKQARRSDKSITKQKVADRAQYLEDTFLPHVAATLQLSKHIGIDPLELKGSRSGAVGLSQFLPGNVIKYGVDADSDTVVNMFQAPDAILSTANFLASHGWSKDTKSKAEKRAIIWNYNRSEPYVDTVLEIAQGHQRRILVMRDSNKKNNRG